MFRSNNLRLFGGLRIRFRTILRNLPYPFIGKRPLRHYVRVEEIINPT